MHLLVWNPLLPCTPPALHLPHVPCADVAARCMRYGLTACAKSTVAPSALLRHDWLYHAHHLTSRTPHPIPQPTTRSAVTHTPDPPVHGHRPRH